MIFLSLMVQKQNIRVGQDDWQHSGETIKQYYDVVLQIVCALLHEYKHPPNYHQVHQFLSDNAYKFLPWFQVDIYCT